MQTWTSVSGGQTSAYIAANYPSDVLIFALVRIDNAESMYPDESIRKIVSDKIGAEFIATSEDDAIIRTMLDLEQFIGKEIKWVTGETFDDVIKSRGGYLPNIMTRYCTSFLKIKPMFDYWHSLDIDPVTMQIGFRANETKRANRMIEKVNGSGYLTHRSVIGKTKDGRNRWAEIEWQRPAFPLIDDNIYKVDIQNYWKGKPVKFAEYNNCVGCFHRNPPFLRFMYQEHPTKMDWFEKQEGGTNGYWKSVNGEVIKYSRIKNMLKQMTLFSEDFTSCDSGYCELT
jgi:hypothetical protein